MFKGTPLERKIAALAQPVIEDLGFSLVAVRMTGENKACTVQIMAEDPKTHNIGLEDCTRISKAVSAVMDVEDPIQGHYRLEVSSPGIDRPLVRPEDFARYIGFEAKIELDAPSAEGQKRFKGILLGIEGGMIALDTENGKVELPYESVHKAKLVLTDELIKATSKPLEER